MRRKSTAGGMGRFGKICCGSAYAEPTHPRRIAGGDSSPAAKAWSEREENLPLAAWAASGRFAAVPHARNLLIHEESPEAILLRQQRRGVDEKKIYRWRHGPLREDLLRFRRAEPAHS